MKGKWEIASALDEVFNAFINEKVTKGEAMDLVDDIINDITHGPAKVWAAIMSERYFRRDAPFYKTARRKDEDEE